ncbi:MAG: NUDIX domain-containing protein [Endomicrobium sp.]|jgi:8-oxo-dGTP pyrophosphatase MutT (NUDIX family)|nr:NUDIX domain-containing protein [Endomicrobium sp.]
MLKEFSCGAIVYKMINGSPVFLLVMSKVNKIWGFPKGHVEKGENEIETAKREIFEETGIKKLSFFENFRQEDVYIINSKKIEKHSIYFLALALEDDTTNFDKNEISEIKWTNIEHTLSLLSFVKQKEIINMAYKLLLI